MRQRQQAVSVCAVRVPLVPSSAWAAASVFDAVAPSIACRQTSCHQAALAGGFLLAYDNGSIAVRLGWLAMWGDHHARPSPGF